MKEFWDNRYKEKGFAYGKEPNVFVKESLDSLNHVGRALFPAEGEGRNSVYAATKGWNAIAYDISSAGQEKALDLAKKHETHIDYRIGGFMDIEFPEEQFDLLVYNYVHMPKPMKASVFRRHMPWMKPNSTVIFEAFSVNNLPYREANPGVGGPDQLDMLYSIEEVKELLDGFSNLKVWEEEVNLSEGKYHIGKAKVIRDINK